MENNTIVTKAIVTNDNLSNPLASCAVIAIAEATAAKLPSNQRFSRHKAVSRASADGTVKPSKLAASCAVSLPILTSADIASFSNNATIAEYIRSSLESLQDKVVRSQLEAGSKVIAFDSVTAAKCEDWLLTSSESNGIGQLSAERIAAWFDSSEGNARDSVRIWAMLRLNLGDDVTSDEAAKVEQICNSARDTMKELAKKTAPSFSPKVESNLRAMFAQIAADAPEDTFVGRLVAKLDVPKVAADNLMELL